MATTRTRLEFVNRWCGKRLKVYSARLGSGGKLVVADEGATRQTVKKRLQAAADANGKKIRFLRSPSEFVIFQVVE